MSDKVIYVNESSQDILGLIEYLYGTHGKEVWLKYSKLNIPQAKRTDWQTPSWLIEEMQQEFNLQLDVCASHKNTALPAWLSLDMRVASGDKTYNALTVDSWRKPNILNHKLDWQYTPEFKRIWLNPPFDQIPEFMNKVQYNLGLPQYKNIEIAVCLLPYRAGSRWFYDLVHKPLFETHEDNIIVPTLGDYYYGFASRKTGAFKTGSMAKGRTGELRILRSRLAFDEKTSKAVAPFDCCLAIFYGQGA